MPRSDFYNHNRFIAYPLKEREESLFPFSGFNVRESALLDAGFVIGIDADFDPEYRVKLTQIVVAGALVTFTFQDEGATATFDIVCDASDPEGTLYEADATEGAAYGSAYVVGGDLTTLIGEIPPGTYAASEAFYVEEGVIQSLYGHYVKQFTVASQPDTPWHMPADCGGSPSDIWKYVVTGRNLQGHQKFKAGYNATIAVLELDNAIEIGAGVGAGEGEPCERVYLGSESSFSSWSSLSLSSLSLSSVSLSSSSFSFMSSSSMSHSSMSTVIDPTRCKDVFNTISGVWPDSGGNFTLKALSSGLEITTEPENHKIIVEFRTGANAPYCEED